MLEESSISLNPIHFFSISCDIYPLKERFPSLSHHLLPSTESFTQEEIFAKIALGWSLGGIGLVVEVKNLPETSHYPNPERGDSLELFLDTRDMKSAGFNTRFCHHFFFLPQMVGGIAKGEITRFRTEDQHPLCQSDDLFLEVKEKKKGYMMQIFIPASCLHGYDPLQFNRLGFTYRVNRAKGKPQHFSVVSSEYSIDQHPSLWGSLVLIQNESASPKKLS